MNTRLKIDPVVASELMQSAEKVMEFVGRVKWSHGYSCRQCGNTNYCSGKSPYSRRCTRCKKEESATAHTLFHNVKFPLHKAFQIAYDVCVLRNELSAVNYSVQLGINPMTCWKFRKRIAKCVERSKQKPEKMELETILLSHSF